MGEVRYYSYYLILRIYLRLPERKLDFYPELLGYGTISVDITPPLSYKLPPTKPTVIFVSGLMASKNSALTRTQIYPLADPLGRYRYRIVFVNFRGQFGNPVTSGRIFDPLQDNDDLAAVYTRSSQILRLFDRGNASALVSSIL
jgi:predicted alpha/beta-fold hydrolase